MKKSKCISSLVIIVAMVMGLAPVCTAGSYVLLVEQTPIEGGIINPGIGVHSFTPGEMVTITATPRPGYQFVRWMGDVSVTDTSTTTVTLDAPKMLVAVFERVEYALFSEELVEDQGVVGGVGGGGGGLTRQSPAVGGGGGVSPSGSPRYSTSSYTPPVTPDDEDTGGDIPVPTPEPGTIAMMIMGATIVRRRIN